MNIESNFNMILKYKNSRATWVFEKKKKHVVQKLLYNGILFNKII